MFLINSKKKSKTQKFKHVIVLDVIFNLFDNTFARLSDEMPILLNRVRVIEYNVYNVVFFVVAVDN